MEKQRTNEPPVTKHCHHKSHWSVPSHPHSDSAFVIRRPDEFERNELKRMIDAIDHTFCWALQNMWYTWCFNWCAVWAKAAIFSQTKISFKIQSWWKAIQWRIVTNVSSGASLVFNVSTSYWLPWKRNLCETDWVLSSVTWHNSIETTWKKPPVRLPFFSFTWQCNWRWGCAIISSNEYFATAH